MLRLLVIVLLCATSFQIIPAQEKGKVQGQSLTLQDVLYYRPRLPYFTSPRWVGKGHALRQGRKVVDAATGKSVKVPVPAARPNRGALRKKLNAAMGKAGVKGRPQQLQWLPGSGACIFRAAGDVHVWDVKKGLTSITGDPDAEETLLQSAPNGSMGLLRKNHDLWLVSLVGKGSRLRRVTRVGGPERLIGRLDWVYQEEVFGRGRWDAYWWSPTGGHLAFLDLDTSQEPKSPIVDNTPFRQSFRLQRYPKPGEPNARCLVGMVPVAGGKVRRLDPRKWGGEEALVVRVDWGPGPALYLQIMDREQRQLSLVRWEPGGKARVLLAEKRTDGWIRRSPKPVFLAGGKEFLWRSDRDGLARLYRYDQSGKLLGKVTAGSWDLKRLVAVDEKGGRLWCMGTEGMALESHLFRVPLSGGKGQRLTRPGFSHSIRLSPDRTFFIDTFSSVDNPGGADLCREKDGELVRELGRRNAGSLARYKLGQVQLHKVPGEKGCSINALTVSPPGWDGQSKLPVWFDVYGGPGAQTVRNRWRLSPWAHFLAGQGVLVVKCDPRSASGRGHRFSLLCYQNLGHVELTDLTACVDYLVKKGWADRERVGITGVSYGGFLVNYALTHSQVFRCGIAVAGLSDWRNYDTIYTERYMRTPAANPAGYRLSSCLEVAAKMVGHLLLVHGDMDDNVHVANTFQLANALQRANKQNFSLQIYPRNGHGINRREHRTHYRRLVWQFIQEHLL